MELRQMEFFLQVVTEKSFTKAAQKLFVAQPAISKSIQKLEKELGVYLFKRGEKSIALTAEGERFLQYAQTIMEQVRMAKLEMAELAGLEKGEVTLGIPSMAGSYYFPNIIVDFKNRFPKLDISILEAGTKEIHRMLEEGEIDLGVVVVDNNTSSQLEILPFLNEEMVICVPSTHPFANKQAVPLEELAEEPLVLFKEGYYQRDIIHLAAEKKGIEPTIILETNQISLTKSLTRKGLGITLFLKMVISDDPDLVPVSLEPPVYLQLALAWKKKSYFSKANQTFLQFFIEQTNSHKGG